MRVATQSGRRLDETGQVAVEYALSLPFLIGLVYGIVEISHFAYLRTTMTNVAHDGVRYAVVHGSNSAQPLGVSDITSYVSNELIALGLNGNGAGGTAVTVTYNPGNSPGSTVSVQISYPFVPFMTGFDQIPGLTTQSQSSGGSNANAASSPGAPVTFTSLVGPIMGSSQMTVSP